jgi:hypothetical protein
VVLDRRRIDPSTANRFDPEPALIRSFDLARPEEFSLTGMWSPSAHVADGVVQDSSEALLGVISHLFLGHTIALAIQS